MRTFVGKVEIELTYMKKDEEWWVKRDDLIRVFNQIVCASVKLGAFETSQIFADLVDLISKELEVEKK